MSQTNLPEVTIAVCAFNEAANVGRVLTELLSLKINKEIMIIDDASTDATPQIIKSMADKSNGLIKIFKHEKRKGKGAGIITAIKHSSGRYFCIQDADLEYDPHDIDRIMEDITQNSLDACFGSRFIEPNPVIYPHCAFANKFISKWISLLTGTLITDSYTGRKIIRTNLIKGLSLEKYGFDIEAEISTKIGTLTGQGKIKFSEAPISYNPRTVKEGKKIRLMDAIKAFLVPLQIKLKGTW
ncbi:glycosyltransferase family 2 protein [Elusimicrobiota bacterium]